MERVKEELSITDEMLEQLTEGMSTQEDVFGKNGLLRQLQKRILEKMLNKEPDEHLAMENSCHSPRIIGTVKAARQSNLNLERCPSIRPVTDQERSSQSSFLNVSVELACSMTQLWRFTAKG
jgi:hypothetical protein